MLQIVQSLSDKISKFLSEDPVRPNIPHINRIGENKDVFLMCDNLDSVSAITCVSYQNIIPKSENELFQTGSNPDSAIFYTIWSYKPGAGRNLLFEVVNYIKENKPNISRFVTLSPKTEMAKKFHLKNNAIIFRENTSTVNYEYLINKR